MHTSTGSTVSSALRSETHEQRRAGWPVAEAFISCAVSRRMTIPALAPHGVVLGRLPHVS